MSKTVNDIMQMKSREKITVLTGYDSTMTTLCDKVDVILVGDSAGMVMLGYDDTRDVTIVDNVTRAMKLLVSESRKPRKQSTFDNKRNLKSTILEIRKNLERRAKNV